MRGGTIKGVIGELLGRQAGMSNGKGGSMHIFTPSFFGGNGIVGAQVPVGAGVAFAQQYKGEKTCTFALYGDGASNQGQVFEAFNMVCYCVLLTSILQWVVFAVDRLNSGISLPSSFVKTTSTEWAHQRLVALPTPSISRVVTKSLVFRSVFFRYFTRIPPRFTLSSTIGQWNGYHCIKTCCRICQEMGGWRRQRSTFTWIRYIPLWRTFVRFPFYFLSWFNYVITRMSDPGTTYRTREEVQRMRSTQDPIRGLQKNIEEWGVATEQELKVLVYFRHARRC